VKGVFLDEGWEKRLRSHRMRHMLVTSGGQNLRALNSKKEKGKETRKRKRIISMVIMIIIIPQSTTSTNIHIHYYNTIFLCPKSIAGVPFD